jgi:hypothetical protein
VDGADDPRVLTVAYASSSNTSEAYPVDWDRLVDAYAQLYQSYPRVQAESRIQRHIAQQAPWSEEGLIDKYNRTLTDLRRLATLSPDDRQAALMRGLHVAADIQRLHPNVGELVALDDAVDTGLQIQFHPVGELNSLERLITGREEVLVPLANRTPLIVTTSQVPESAQVIQDTWESLQSSIAEEEYVPNSYAYITQPPPSQVDMSEAIRHQDEEVRKHALSQAITPDLRETFSWLGPPAIDRQKSVEREENN